MKNQKKKIKIFKNISKAYQKVNKQNFREKIIGVNVLIIFY